MARARLGSAANVAHDLRGVSGSNTHITFAICIARRTGDERDGVDMEKSGDGEERTETSPPGSEQEVERTASLHMLITLVISRSIGKRQEVKVLGLWSGWFHGVRTNDRLETIHSISFVLPFLYP